jgi:hypothetical protein
MSFAGNFRHAVSQHFEQSCEQRIAGDAEAVRLLPQLFEHFPLEHCLRHPLCSKSLLLLLPCFSKQI